MSITTLDDKALSCNHLLGSPNGFSAIDAESDTKVTVVELDVETQSACDLGECGNWRYSEDPSTSALCLVYKIGGERFEHAFTEAEAKARAYAIPDRLQFVFTRPHSVVTAHNAPFEQSIWRNVLGWPEPTGGWRCSMGLCAANAMPQGLDDVSKVLRLGEKDKLGYRLMLKYCKPGKDGILRWPNKQDMAAIVSYCGQDVDLEAGVVEQLGGVLQPGEQEVWELCNRINVRGVHIDQDLARAAIAWRTKLEDGQLALVEQATGGAVKVSDLYRVKFLRDWLANRGCEVDKLTAPIVARLLATNTLPDDVRAVLIGRQTVSKSSTAKLDTMLAAASLKDGRIRGCFNYHGALTGRWSGRLIQPQNLPRPTIKEEIAVPAVLSSGPGEVTEETLKSVIRACISAPPGKVLLVCDWAAVEFRCALWLAQDEPHLEQIRQGVNMYCDMGGKIFGRVITKHECPIEYAVGKTSDLGCIYGMGSDKFDVTCKILGIDLAAAGTSAVEVVGTFREEFSSLAGKRRLRQGEPGGLWARLGAAAIYTVETHNPASVGHIGFRMDASGRLRMDLPSGRSLTYWNPRVVEEQIDWYTPEGEYRPFMGKDVWFDDFTSKNKATGKVPNPTKAWGGHWLENACQAVCRDLLVAAMAECERQELPIVMHVHDEIVPEVDESDGPDALKRLEKIMVTPPAWAEGFPLAVEGKVTKRYCK
jgi:DNA polymerase